jgi:hypothetical protein
MGRFSQREWCQEMHRKACCHIECRWI